MRRTKLFAGSSHRELATLVAQRLGHPLSNVALQAFANRETSVHIGVSVRNEDVFIIQSGSDTVNDHLMELLIMVNACKSASASRITAVIPYFPYSKQCKRKKERGAIAAKLVANMLSVAGVDHIITMDLHASQMQGFFNRPIDNLVAEPCIIRWVRDNVPEWQDAVVVSKNAGGVKRVTSMADKLGINFALIHTDRNPHRQEAWSTLSSRAPSRVPSDAEDDEEDEDEEDEEDEVVAGAEAAVEQANLHHRLASVNEVSADDAVTAGSGAPSDVSKARETKAVVVADESSGESCDRRVKQVQRLSLVGSVRGRVALLVDDMIDKPHSFLQAAEQLMQCGAKAVYILATHGILSGNALQLIETSPMVRRVVVTNTFPVSAAKRQLTSKLTVIDVSSVFSEAIRRTHNGESVSFLFDHAI
ncbi:phosphoribosyltransferase-like protein [Thamnocephalis sphaerospora]|uniref:Ribose-phosphate pyrophosphokinase 1 n=1 Tax=Thamnocephalis sphaerospora TaxID=78915 RepID=A0A4V1IWF9_9FUNG|nr:phosphoribosyltransferase-like protein [Thamnocephalis sphaerospora]|eukprot:RKP07419.1 phosphoribosyltransferase-like protein [Thamnocephalis sphaerospora]